MTVVLPALFIGSSAEGLGTAYAIQQALEYDAEPTVWSQGLFQPSQTVLSDLVKTLPRCGFAACVFSPDDSALPSVWQHASTALPMPNHAAESWTPLPAIAQVHALWTTP